MPPRLPHVVDGRSQRWASHNAERRRVVLDAAVVLLEQRPPGHELHLQEIADEAGVGRPVVYRHFKDKAELNRAIQGHVVDMAWQQIQEDLVLHPSPRATVQKIVGAFVDWVHDHPALYAVAERELGDGKPSELTRMLDEVAEAVSEVVRFGADLLDVELEPSHWTTLDLLVVGLIGQVRGTLAQWVRRPHPEVDHARLTELLTEWIWFQIDGQARQLGVVLDPWGPLLPAGLLPTEPDDPAPAPSAP